jgi:hypothetical protein
MRQFQIQQNQVGQGKSPAIGELARAFEIIDRLSPVSHDVQWVGDARFVHGMFEEKHIVGIVVNVENWFHKFVYAFFNWIQKLLPLPGSESKPTSAPIRSTALRTIVRPMPVPS